MSEVRQRTKSANAEGDISTTQLTEFHHIPSSINIVNWNSVGIASIETMEAGGIVNTEEKGTSIRRLLSGFQTTSSKFFKSISSICLNWFFSESVDHNGVSKSSLFGTIERIFMEGLISMFLGLYFLIEKKSCFFESNLRWLGFISFRHLVLIAISMRFHINPTITFYRQMLGKSYLLITFLFILSQWSGSYLAINLIGLMDNSIDLCEGTNRSFPKLEGSHTFTLSLYFIVGFFLGCGREICNKGNLYGYQWGNSKLEKFVNLLGYIVILYGPHFGQITAFCRRTISQSCTTKCDWLLILFSLLFHCLGATLGGLFCPYLNRVGDVCCRGLYMKQSPTLIQESTL